MRAVLSNAKHPEYGQVTIPFPLAQDQYDDCVELLEKLGIGDVVERDCKVEEIQDGLPILKRLEKVAVNIDELDYLAKRLDSFDYIEAAQFQAMAVKTGVFDMKDLINLTFCCQQSTVITDFSDLEATLKDMEPGVYVVREESVPEPYVVSHTEQTVALRPGKTSEVRFQDYVKPGLEILKRNIANGDPIEGVTYKIEQIDGSYATTATTDSTGRIFLDSIPVGSYQVTEINVPSNVILCEIPQTIALEAGCTRTVTFFNAVKPSLTILKRNSITTDPLSNAKFHIYYASDNTTTGEINDLGVFTSGSDGKIILTDVNRGWYKLVEESAPKGFGIQGSGVNEFYLEANTSKTVTVDNVPLSALVVYKYDGKTGAGLEGCRFELRYLSGDTSGAGGTVVPANFRQVEAPRVYCNVVSWLTGGTQFVNQADVGGVYDSQWIMATSRWVTKVYKPSAPLPRTGY